LCVLSVCRCFSRFKGFFLLSANFLPSRTRQPHRMVCACFLSCGETGFLVRPPPHPPLLFFSFLSSLRGCFGNEANFERVVDLGRCVVCVLLLFWCCCVVLFCFPLSLSLSPLSSPPPLFFFLRFVVCFFRAFLGGRYLSADFLSAANVCASSFKNNQNSNKNGNNQLQAKRCCVCVFGAIIIIIITTCTFGLAPLLVFSPRRRRKKTLIKSREENVGGGGLFWLLCMWCDQQQGLNTEEGVEECGRRRTTTAKQQRQTSSRAHTCVCVRCGVVSQQQ